MSKFTMPIQNRKGKELDGPFVWTPTPEDHQQAITNHGQTLKHLAERGGMSWAEMAYILLGRRYDYGTAIHTRPEYAKAVCRDALRMPGRAALDQGVGE